MVPKEGLALNPVVRRVLLFIVTACGLFLSAYLPLAARRARGSLPAPTPRPAGPPARLVADTAEHDFGEVYQGSRVRHVFVLSNQGPGAAVVERTATSCGCTATLLSQTDIPPGGQARLEATFSAGQRKGAFRKSISVFSNDPASPLTLHIKGTLEPLLAIEPEVLDFGIVRMGQEVRRTLVLRSPRKGAGVRPGRPAAGFMPLRMEEPRPAPGGAWTMVVVARPDNPGQVLWGTLAIPTGNEAVPTVRVRVMGRVVP